MIYSHQSLGKPLYDLILRMNWKLIFGFSFLLCLFSDIILVVIALFTEIFTPGYEMMSWLFFIIWILCMLVIPIWVIRRKISSSRFWHGLTVGILGGVMGAVNIFVLIIILMAFSSVAREDPAGAGQAVAVLVLFTLIISPIYGIFIGFFSWVAGKSLDRKATIQNSEGITKDEL